MGTNVSSSFTVYNYSSFGNLFPSPPVPPRPICGDGKVDTYEGCDDGNKVNGDGCSNGCWKELLVQCAIDRECSTALCVSGKCSECDNDSDCAEGMCAAGQCIGFCGNGVVEAHEQCDAGNQNSDLFPDSCRSNCVAPACGDGVRDAGEACDDGNDINGDGCDNSCGLVQSAVAVIDPGIPGQEPDTQTSPEIIPGFPNPLPGQLTDVVTSNPPAGQTGPVTILVMAAGAAGGWAVMRRRRK